MADEKSIVKMNKMIHKKTGTSFLVVYVINVKLQLHSAIYRLRFYSNSLIHISSLSNSHSDVTSIQKNRGDKSHSVIVALALCIQIARKLHHAYSPDIPSLQLLEGKLNAYLYAYRAVSICSIMFWTI